VRVRELKTSKKKGHKMSVSFLHSLSVLLPALFVMTLGFWAGRTREFNQEQLDGLTELVLKY
jgi:predicted permease